MDQTQKQLQHGRDGGSCPWTWRRVLALAADHSALMTYVWLLVALVIGPVHPTVKLTEAAPVVA